MTERYQVVSKNDSLATLNSATAAEALAKDGQFLLPMLDLIENAQLAIDDLSTSWAAPLSKLFSR